MHAAALFGWARLAVLVSGKDDESLSEVSVREDHNREPAAVVVARLGVLYCIVCLL